MQEMPTYAVLLPPSAKSLVTLIRWTFAFLYFAVAAGIIGFGGIASGFENIAKTLSGLFLFIFGLMLAKVISAGKKVR